MIQMNRDFVNLLNEDSNNDDSGQSSDILPNNISLNKLAVMDESTVSDDAVVASSTTQNSDNSITMGYKEKSSDK